MTGGRLKRLKNFVGSETFYLLTEMEYQMLI